LSRTQSLEKARVKTRDQSVDKHVACNGEKQDEMLNSTCPFDFNPI